MRTAYLLRHGQHMMKKAMKEDEVEIVVQINGKVKGKLVIGAEEDKDSVLRKLRKFLEIN